MMARSRKLPISAAKFGISGTHASSRMGAHTAPRSNTKIVSERNKLGFSIKRRMLPKPSAATFAAVGTSIAGSTSHCTSQTMPWNNARIRAGGTGLRIVMVSHEANWKAGWSNSPLTTVSNQ